MTQWYIYDAYLKDINAAEAAKNAGKEKKGSALDLDTKKKPSESDPIYSDAMKLSIKLMERMVNQNAENEIYHDFKYWEDKSDEYRPDGEGTLLPLWRFTSEKVKRKQVTAIRWNPRYEE